ncbi:MAG: histidine kinase, partial [Saprospiraceae bacterium]
SVENGQPIRFTKLPPGDYTLRVQAEDVNGNTSEIRELPIEITPPFWQTWWFYGLCGVVVLAAAYAFYRYRIRQIQIEAAKKTAVAQLELQVIENELKALRAQMNPHFLFNTMNSIKGIIIQQKTQRAIEYLSKLSSLIRAILSNSERKTISLAKELAALRLYIELESLRFSSEFNYQISVGKQVDTSFVNIPPLVLQPFVENAIWHGLLPKVEKDNQLKIHIYRAEDFILFEIEDNGIGRAAAQANRRKKTHESMGIGITTKRIELLHAENDISIVDLYDEQREPIGTKVILKLFAPD